MNSVKFIPNKSQSKVLAKNSKTNAELTYFLCKRLVWEPILWTGPENTALDSISGKRTLLFLRCLGASWRALLKSRNSHKTHGIYCFRKKKTLVLMISGKLHSNAPVGDGGTVEVWVTFWTRLVLEKLLFSSDLKNGNFMKSRDFLRFFGAFSKHRVVFADLRMPTCLVSRNRISKQSKKVSNLSP